MLCAIYDLRRPVLRKNERLGAVRACIDPDTLNVTLHSVSRGDGILLLYIA